jgi:hypothetical protein
MFGREEVQAPFPFVGTEPRNLYDFRTTTCGGEFWRLRQQHGHVGTARGEYEDESKVD